MIAGLVRVLAGWKGYALALAIGVALGGGGVWKVRDWMAAETAAEAAREDLRGAIEVGERTQASAEITQDVGTDVAQREVETRVIYRTITERIPTYVTQEANRQCIVPAGFVRVHDAAAAGSAAAVPDGPGQPADAPSGVALSTVADTIVDNYGACQGIRNVALGWQDWYAQQKAAWEAKPDD